jgi:hypothetical protein
MELYLIVSYSRHRSDETWKMVSMKCVKEFIIHFNKKFHVSNSSLSLMASIKLPFFLSFFAILTSFYIIVLGLEGYCCTWSMTHTHAVGLPGRGIGPSQSPLPDNTHLSQETAMFPAGIRTRNSKKLEAADLRAAVEIVICLNEQINTNFLRTLSVFSKNLILVVDNYKLPGWSGV